MAVIATDSTRFSALVKHEYEPQLSYCRESVVINDAAGTLKVGAVLGKVTATGKYKLVDPAAVDGSQEVAGLLIADVNGHSGDIELAAATDTKAIVLVRGPAIVAGSALQYGAAVDLQSEKDAVVAKLKTLGIIVETAV